MFSGQEWHCNVTLLYFWPLAENNERIKQLHTLQEAFNGFIELFSPLTIGGGKLHDKFKIPRQNRESVYPPEVSLSLTDTHTHSHTHSLAQSHTHAHIHTHAAADLTPYLTWTCPSSTTQDLPSEAPCMLIYYNKTENGVFVQVRVW